MHIFYKPKNRKNEKVLNKEKNSSTIVTNKQPYNSKYKQSFKNLVYIHHTLVESQFQKIVFFSLSITIKNLLKISLEKYITIDSTW